MKLMPSSTARLRTAFATSRSAGGPQIPSPVSRMAPNPSRHTSRSPPRTMAPAADASVVVEATACPYPQDGVFNRSSRPRLGFGLEREGELNVGPRDGDERAGLGRAAVQRCELRIDEGDEVHVAAVQVVGEPAAVTLPRQRQVPDDPMAVGLEHDAFDPRLHTLNISAGRPPTLSWGAARARGGRRRSPPP